jgi:cation diffusion facilitator family transporter
MAAVDNGGCRRSQPDTPAQPFIPPCYQACMPVHRSRKQIYSEVRWAACVGLCVNLMLSLAKLIGGVVGHSFALIADAVNSIGDVVSNVLVLFALHIAQTPADEEHPYGHSRAEGIAASNVAVLIIVSAIWVGWEAIGRINQSQAMPPLWTLWLSAANVAIKELLFQYKQRVGQRTGSAAIVASAWDHRSDAFCSLAVLCGLAVIRIGGPAYLWADTVASLAVVAAIIWSGGRLFRSSAKELMDLQATPEVLQGIREEALGTPGVKDVETLWVRKSGLEFFADIHIQVAAEMTVADGHRIGHQVKDRLLKRYAMLRDVLVHLEPYPHVHDH